MTPEPPDGDAIRAPRGAALRRPIPAVALVVVLAAAAVGAGTLLTADGEERFCTLDAPVPPRSFELAGYEVSLQDSGSPGPDRCDGPDRPRPFGENDDTGGYRVPPAPTSSRPGRDPVAEGFDPRVVLGFDCRYRDADGEVVATAEPNRPDGTCTIPDR